ncbi:MAG: CocE/NonD family hydrolase, partial [Alphaproteobacteria bacterium]
IPKAMGSGTIERMFYSARTGCWARLCFHEEFRPETDSLCRSFDPVYDGDQVLRMTADREERMSVSGNKSALTFTHNGFAWIIVIFSPLCLVSLAIRSSADVPVASVSLDYQIDKNVMVAMRDGIRLATDIYLPARQGHKLPGEFPVLVYRTPYNKDGLRRAGIYFAQHGYVVVAQDCRGRFASQGEFDLLRSDGRDGYDTIEWAGIQPWSNGRVGTAGASYEAWTQYAAAMLSPPHLTAMFPTVGWDSFYRYALNGGVPSLSMSEWMLFMAETSKEASRMPALREKLESTFKAPVPWLQLSPTQRAAIFDALPGYKRIFEDTYAHSSFDSYWQQPNLDLPANYRKFKDVPMFFVSGWYDGTVGGVVRNFVELSSLQKSPKELLIGPWPHATGNSTCGDADFGPSAAVDEQALELDWFDHWLKGEPFKIIGSSPIVLFQMGGGLRSDKLGDRLEAGGGWISLKAWLQSEARTERLYLQPQNQLLRAPARRIESASFDYNPSNPVPSFGGYLHGECVQDQTKLEKRSDVLVFNTPILTRSVAITGTVQVRLWVSTTAADTDFIAKLTDVYPNGYSMIVEEGEMRMSAGERAGHVAPLAPGKIYSATISLGPTSNLFVTGHRIRLDISSTDFPRLEPNPNTGELQGRWTRGYEARNSIYYGGRYPSQLVLPLLHTQSHQHPFETLANPVK